MAAKKYHPSNKEELEELVINPEICLGDIDTSLITDMSGLFEDCGREDFSGIELWNTSQVTNMSSMFFGAEFFNAPIGCWDVSGVKNMDAMFAEAPAFNQPLNMWNTSRVTSMRCMFNLAENFNQPLDNWNTAQVTDMSPV